MKALIPAVVLLQLYLVFLVSVFITPAILPERFATEFNFAGEPECWMNQTTYMILVSAMGSLAIFVMVIIGLVGRWLPDKWISMPHREYWLAPQRRAETVGYVFRQMLWFASLLTCFLTATHFSTIHANKLDPIHLPQGEFFMILGGFLGGTLIWTLMFIIHFIRRTD
jgi:uncharacterized membrane protein